MVAETKPITRPISAAYGGETYYEMPVVKHSHYQWLTVGSFYSEGIGGAAQFIATLIDLIGREEDRPLVRSGRYLALGGGLVAPTLLISSMHTPQRFYNFLRIFRTTSPMSIGSWSLTLFGFLSGNAAVGQLLEDLGFKSAGRWTSRIFAIPASATGGMTALYIGTELEETSTPLWASAFPLLSPLFASTNASNALSAMILTSFGETEETHLRLERLAAVVGSLQLLIASSVETRWRKEPAAGSFNVSWYGTAFRFGVLGLGGILPLMMRIAMLVDKKRSPLWSKAAAGASLAGGLLVPLLIVYGGRESGKHPRDYFHYTRPAPRIPVMKADEPPIQQSVGVERPDAPRRSRFWTGLFALGAAAMTLLLTRSSAGK